MIQYGLQQAVFSSNGRVRVPPIMQEEKPLAKSPEWRGPEFVRSSLALADPIG
jgi:hypothetical protein